MKHDLIVREPELYFDSIHQELDNFLRDTFFTHTFGHPLNIIKNSTWRPAVEVVQNKNNYKVRVQLPGVKKDDIEVELDNDFMTITAVINEEKEERREEEHNARYHTSEFRYGKYQRTISFDQPIKAEDANANYKDGVLTITVPKQKIEAAKPKKLTINSADKEIDKNKDKENGKDADKDRHLNTEENKEDNKEKEHKNENEIENQYENEKNE